MGGPNVMANPNQLLIASSLKMNRMGTDHTVKLSTRFMTLWKVSGTRSFQSENEYIFLSRLKRLLNTSVTTPFIRIEYRVRPVRMRADGPYRVMADSGWDCGFSVV